MNNQIQNDILKQQSIFDPTLQVNCRDLEVIIKDNKIIKINLSFIDPNLDFIKNIEKQNSKLKNTDKFINIHDNLDISTFGLKIINNKNIIIKIIHISETEKKKQLSLKMVDYYSLLMIFFQKMVV